MLKEDGVQNLKHWYMYAYAVSKHLEALSWQIVCALSMMQLQSQLCNALAFSCALKHLSASRY